MNNKKNIKELVSVVMPAYNAEKYLEAAVNSVLNQTYWNWELILIDDGSSDNTINIAKKLVKKDNRIKLIFNPENLGVSATRNKGINLAQGNWIAFLDSDDIWKDSKIEKQISFAKEKNVDFIFSGVCYIAENGSPFKGIFNVPFKTSFQELLKQNIITCSSVLIKKHHFDHVKMEKDHMHEDYAVWLRILSDGIFAYGINEPLLVYRISTTSKSGRKINSFKMTYRVFRFINLNPYKSILYTGSHLYRSYIKYKNIKNPNIS